MDASSVVENWSDRDRRSVSDIDLFCSYLAEDLSYMSAPALRYFLPALLGLFLRSPERIDFGGFICLISRLEGLVGLRDDHDGGFYRPVSLTQEQRLAIREFCTQVMTIIKKFDLDSFEAEYQGRLKEIRKNVLIFSCEEDYDAELFAQSKPKTKTRRTRRR